MIRKLRQYVTPMQTYAAYDVPNPLAITQPDSAPDPQHATIDIPLPTRKRVTDAVRARSTSARHAASPQAQPMHQRPPTRKYALPRPHSQCSLNTSTQPRSLTRSLARQLALRAAAAKGPRFRQRKTRARPATPPSPTHFGRRWKSIVFGPAGPSYAFFL